MPTTEWRIRCQLKDRTATHRGHDHRKPSAAQAIVAAQRMNDETVRDRHAAYADCKPWYVESRQVGDWEPLLEADQP